jgi:hypothetical protein
LQGVGYNLSRDAIDADSFNQTNERGGKESVISQIDLFAPHKLGFQVFGQDSGRSKPAAKLQTGFAQSMRTTLILR